jgi:hypothetical protein
MPAKSNFGGALADIPTTHPADSAFWMTPPPKQFVTSLHLYNQFQQCTPVPPLSLPSSAPPPLDFTHFLRVADAGEEQPAKDRETAAVTGRVAGERTGEAVNGQLDENHAAEADAVDEKAHEEVLDIVGRGISALDAIASAVPLNE